MRTVTQGRTTTASHSAFAAFGVFWGTWGAALPALRDAAGLDNAALGTALLFVGLGALPAMLLSGRAVDRFGARAAGWLLISLALAGVITAVLARDLPTLAVAMALVGATSGAADVAANALAGLAEQRSGRRVITISHAVFSSFVVIGSLGTGVLRATGADVMTVFIVAGALMTVAGAMALVLGDGPQPASRAKPARRRDGLRLVLPFVAVGLVGALGFAAENAHQSWSAIFLADELGAAPGITAIAPATFAAFTALTRFAAGAFTRIPTGGLLVGGAVTALLGTLLLSISQDLPLALGGLALAAIGTSVLFPTLLSQATRDVPADRRGRATSAVATTAYLGFVLGPVYVGFLAAEVGMRGAMVGIAIPIAAFAVLAPVVVRRRVHTAAVDGQGSITSMPTRSDTASR
ncbi:MFS transporter [Microbacterium maritypicum]|uniref:MFS transporter n=1 Tax=Microbacterium maritypicum TaxID=33918 RepID=A0A4Y4BB65_MICMQ|nr:MFS transporter [Microbacterium liquefaciens]GEC76809.1 MFS transporter [Microbacterium liquefaciens]GGV64147.1 MFS transporter [Microbacterium liquefaciens]